ncbi:MAG TPA: hypothetical protein VG755_35535, partial [Nannocystaceae bacterium]|nr:hypothetical protein [Nannocystaceae bacterium]
LMALARDAIAMARRIGDADTLRATLSAASFAMAANVVAPNRVDVMRETLQLAIAAGDHRVALRVRAFLVGTAAELGDPRGFDAQIDAIDALAREFSHGRFDWLAAFLRALEARARGHFEAARTHDRVADASLAEDEARGALMAGAAIDVACVTECYDDLTGLASRTRQRFAALAHTLGSVVGELLVAQLHARVGDERRAAAQLRAIAREPVFAAIAEPSWLALLSDACWICGDTNIAERLHAALLPYAELFAWLGPIGGGIGLPYARHLGLVCTVLGRVHDAVAWHERAEALAVHAGTRCHFARLRAELARALLARDADGDRARAAALVADARAIASELGQRGLAPLLDTLGEDRPRATSEPGAIRPRLSLRREGDYWTIAWGAAVVRLKNIRGLALLATLVEHAGQELHVLQLMSPGADEHAHGDAGPVIDARALQEYRARLLELRDELDDAQAIADLARAEVIATEIDRLTEQLAAAVGLGGRERRVGSAAERARTAVQKRLRDALRRIGDELPELGRHLDQSVRTGSFCGYFPDGRVPR